MNYLYLRKNARMYILSSNDIIISEKFFTNTSEAVIYFRNYVSSFPRVYLMGDLW